SSRDSKPWPFNVYSGIWDETVRQRGGNCGSQLAHRVGVGSPLFGGVGTGTGITELDSARPQLGKIHCMFCLANPLLRVQIAIANEHKRWRSSISNMLNIRFPLFPCLEPRSHRRVGVGTF